jgi:hypothetical protein
MRLLVFEAAAWSGLVLALWFGASSLFLASIAVAGLVGIALVAACPLRVVAIKGGKLHFGSPGPFYSGNP